MDAIILAGGKGTRMESELPKPLIKAKGKAIISHQIDYFLNSKKINNIILSLGYKSEEVINYIKINYPQEKIKFSIESEPLGTGGAIKKALNESTAEKVVVINCDDITNINLERLEKYEENTICIANPRLPFGLVKEKDGYAHFEEKPTLKEHWVSCGWYIFHRKEILKNLPEKGSIEYDVFPKIKIRLHKHTGFWHTLNSKKDLEEFEKIELPSSFL